MSRLTTRINPLKKKKRIMQHTTKIYQTRLLCIEKLGIPHINIVLKVHISTINSLMTKFYCSMIDVLHQVCYSIGHIYRSIEIVSHCNQLLSFYCSLFLILFLFFLAKTI